ncbi:epoxyqueuosine reductase QueH [Candidatus Roizmanbacteria bacterium]|nr:epoxyqueuosine reductase QueH [Candidatus Roizmanbacteria bacterium]
MLLIHTCCTDCVLKLIASLKEELAIQNNEITLFFYNPNIHPRSEYLARMDALKKMIEPHGYKIVFPHWRPVEYFDTVGKLKKADRSDKTKRCPLCWFVRLHATFAYAKEHGFSQVTTTLLTSTYQDTKAIREVATKLSGQFDIPFYVPKKVVCDLETKGFYKQNYCGCVYSLAERMEEKFG